MGIHVGMFAVAVFFSFNHPEKEAAADFMPAMSRCDGLAASGAFAGSHRVLIAAPYLRSAGLVVNWCRVGGSRVSRGLKSARAILH